VIGLSSRPLERYWTFPFITPKKRSVIPHREWREKEKKKQKEKEGSQSYDVSLLLPAGPDSL
jgi:hypothetical protein